MCRSDINKVCFGPLLVGIVLLFVAFCDAAPKGSEPDGTVPWTGQLAGQTVSRLLLDRTGDLLLPSADTIGRILLLLEPQDAKSCLDLGRQIRELQRSPGLEEGIVVFARGPRSEHRRLENFFAIERLRVDTVLSGLEDMPILQGDSQPGTPSILIIGRNGEVRAGLLMPKGIPVFSETTLSEELQKRLRTLGNSPG